MRTQALAVARVPIRAALGAVTGLSMGCVDEAPSFEPRGQIPPFILAGRVEPPLGAVYEGPASFAINVPFRSEDVGIELQARLYLDLPPGAAQASPAQAVSVPAGVFEDLTRSVTMDWSLFPPSCHSLTLILTYRENFSDVDGLPRDDTRAARLVWWLNVGDVEGSVRMSDCPAASQSDPAVPVP